jgi:hypothetical protein
LAGGGGVDGFLGLLPLPGPEGLTVLLGALGGVVLVFAIKLKYLNFEKYFDVTLYDLHGAFAIHSFFASSEKNGLPSMTGLMKNSKGGNMKANEAISGRKLLRIR